MRRTVSPQLSLIPDDNNLKPIARADDEDSEAEEDSDHERSAAKLKSRRWEFKFEEEEGDNSSYAWRDAIKAHHAKYKPAPKSTAPGADPDAAAEDEESD